MAVLLVIGPLSVTMDCDPAGSGVIVPPELLFGLPVAGVVTVEGLTVVVV